MSDEINKLADEASVEGDSQVEAASSSQSDAPSAAAEDGTSIEAAAAENAAAGGPVRESDVDAALDAVEEAVEEVVDEVAESTDEESSDTDAEEAASDADADAEVDEAETDETETDEAEVDEAEDDESAVDEAEVDEAEVDEAEDDEAEAEDEDEAAEVEAAEEAEADSEEIKMDWYILKVQSNREKSITAALKRKIAVEGLEDYFGEVVVPVEKVTEFKGGKKKVVNRKLYPGYIVVNMHINDDTWFAVRETSGIGDFTGSGGKPTPMLPSEVARIVQTEEEETEDAPKLNISFKIGDRVKVNDGNFESFEGEVNAIDEHSGRITVMINIFGRSTPVELEYWQVEQT